MTKNHYYLHLIQTADSVVSEISQVLTIIGDQRLTLAQKAIKNELQICALWQKRLITVLNDMPAGKQCKLFSMKQLRRINCQLHKDLNDFITAAKYNSNYLEQYFEHDFWLRLDSYKTNASLVQIVGQLESRDRIST